MQLLLNTQSSPGVSCVMTNLSIMQVPPIGAAPDMRVLGQKVSLPRNKIFECCRGCIFLMNLSTGAAPEGSADKEGA